MHARRLISFALGIWFAASIVMAVVANLNSRAAERLIDRPTPGLAVQLRTMNPDAARAVVEYHVSERNRLNYELWESVQLGLGALLLLLVLLGTYQPMWPTSAAMAMLAAVLVQRLFLSPEMASLDRQIGLLLPNEAPALRGKLQFDYSVYAGLEAVKLAMQFGLALRLIAGRRSGHSRHARKQVDLIDKSDHRHVNR